MLISGLQTLCRKNNECQGLGAAVRPPINFLSKPIFPHEFISSFGYTLFLDLK